MAYLERRHAYTALGGIVTGVGIGTAKFLYTLFKSNKICREKCGENAEEFKKCVKEMFIQEIKRLGLPVDLAIFFLSLFGVFAVGERGGGYVRDFLSGLVIGEGLSILGQGIHYFLMSIRR